VWDPPPGFDDILGDAEGAPSSRRWAPVSVPEVGAVLCRRPRPNAIGWLAMAANPNVEGVEQRDHLMQFVTHHTDPAELEALQDRMIDADASVPIDAVERIARELAVWGTARPYAAVIELAFHTAHHWRVIRHKLLTSGIADPMRLPSMHPVLDATEAVVLEAMVDYEDPDEAKRKRQQFQDRLYRPAPAKVQLNGERYRPQVAPPPGFEPHEVNASFDVFVRKQGGPPAR
jgi:hypothetical protein